ncbi:uncharacterized protein C7orf57 homolog isoform X2 [Mixophyes fleayi]|uniref:uncharacterized protein C7orf57 homolog isoform X2 n=1 Tax=Mixophyes fleayi TaxID=3061075 RepID=UPI003F4DECE3
MGTGTVVLKVVFVYIGFNGVFTLISCMSERQSSHQEQTMRHLAKEPSGPPSRYASCDWFHHAPLKQSEKTSKDNNPPTSQIPGLSDLAEPHNELMHESRRNWIKETDSDYVKLAKQGGRADLLKQMTPAPNKSSAVAYATPDWYSHDDLTPSELTVAPLRNVPDYMIHEAFGTEQSEQKYEGKRGPFDFDQKTVWQRETEDDGNENHDKKVKLPAINPKTTNDNPVIPSGEGPPLSKAKNDKLGKKCFFPPMPGNKNEAVNFSKLLSNGYGDDWFRQQGEDKKPPQ